MQESRIALTRKEINGFSFYDYESIVVGSGEIYVTKDEWAEQLPFAKRLFLSKDEQNLEIVFANHPFLYFTENDRLHRKNLLTGEILIFSYPFSCSTLAIRDVSPHGRVLSLAQEPNCFDYFNDDGTAIFTFENRSDLSRFFETDPAYPPFWEEGGAVISSNLEGFVIGANPSDCIFHYSWEGKLKATYHTIEGFRFPASGASLSATHLALTDGYRVRVQSLDGRWGRTLDLAAHFAERSIGVVMGRLFHLCNDGTLCFTTFDHPGGQTYMTGLSVIP